MRAGGHTEKVWRVLFQVVWVGGGGEREEAWFLGFILAALNWL